MQGFKIIETLFESDASKVLRAVREDGAKPVILKILNVETPTFSQVAEFKHEYQILQEAQAVTAVPRVIELIKIENSWIIVFEDSCARPLEYFIKNKLLSLDDILTISIDITEALAEIHQLGIIHKDINPSNIIWNENKKKLEIIDFGIATKILHEKPSAKTSNVIRGTLAYCSPEQTGRMNRILDFRTDFYSFGVTLYELLTGERPFKSEDTLELVHQQITKMPISPHEINPAVPEIISRITLKLLNKNQEDRYQTERGIKFDLEQCERELKLKGKISLFEIGKHDLLDRFEVSQKLYGREKEVAELIRLFESAYEGNREVAMVSGYAGIGKSTLIHEIDKPIVNRKGYFIQGKFDQYQRHASTIALRQMLLDFTKQILTESREKITDWRLKIKKAVGENGQILLTLAPEMEQVIGPQPPLVELDQVAAENRYLFVISNFIAALAKKEHPLVIFWDDMQWSDRVSLKLLESILKNVSSGYLFVILSYRDNEISESHLFSLFLKNIKEVPVYHLVLNPLDLESTEHLIADTLRMDEQGVKKLAEICYHKTNGNPFFLNQFLQHLHEKRIIYFDKAKGKWTWVLSDIQVESIAENVVSLLIDRITILPLPVQRLLSLAACIGNNFELSLLATLINKSEKETATLLQVVLQENFIFPLSESYRYAGETESSGTVYRFSHDKIREAAYLLLNDEEKPKVHLKIGQLLLGFIPKEDRYHEVMKITDHLNRGLRFLVGVDEKYQLIQLNLDSGDKAKQSQSYEQSEYYYQTGISLLAADDWEKHYELTYNLYKNAAEISSLVGEYKHMDQLIETALPHCKDVLDALPLYITKVFSLRERGKEFQALKLGVMVLRQLGIYIPLNPKPWHLLRAVIRAKWASRRYTPETMASLPTLTDKKMIGITKMMRVTVTSALKIRPQIFAIITCKWFVEISRHGINSDTIAFPLSVGILLSGIFNQFDLGHKYGQATIDLIHERHEKASLAQVVCGFSLFLNHTQHHLKESIDLLKETFPIALEVGDIEFASMAYLLSRVFQFVIGTNLSEVLEHMSDRQFDKFTIRYLQIFRQTIMNLVTLEEPSHELLGPVYNEKTQIPLHVEKKDTLAIDLLYVNKLMLAYLFDEIPAALRYANAVRPFGKAQMNRFYRPIFLFYETLTCIKTYEKLSFLAKLKMRYRISNNCKQLKKWAESAPMNYAHKYTLVLAEYARIHNQFEKAANLYDQAISEASINQYTQEEALAKELAAKFYFSYEKEKIGKIYLIDAFHSYQLWGAKTKLTQLKKLYPWLERVAVEQQAFSRMLSALTTKTTYQGELLDYASAMKSSTAVASEIVLSKLIARLMHILTENLAAERCVLLLKTNEELLVEGEFTTSKKVFHLLKSLPLSQKSKIPLTVIQYVLSTKETVVLADASCEKQFARDDYILLHQPKSVLCAPLIYQKKLLGMLYFENNLVTNAFLPQSLEFLKLLSSQIIISIENARLYHSFERFVPKQFLDLLGKKDPVDIILGDNIQKKLTILFVDIRGFSALSEKLSAQEVFDLLNHFLSDMEPIITKHKGFIDKFIGDAIMALFPGKVEDAIFAAIEMQRGIQDWKEQYGIHIQAGIGINTGLCTLGTVGSKERMDGSVIGDAVNSASRIEELNKTYNTSILISEKTKAQLSDPTLFGIRCVDNVVLRGRSKETTIYEVLDALPSEIKIKRMNYLLTYEAAVHAFQKGEYKVAKKLFQDCLQQDKTDSICEWYIKRCNQYLKSVSHHHS